MTPPEGAAVTVAAGGNGLAQATITPGASMRGAASVSPAGTNAAQVTITAA